MMTCLSLVIVLAAVALLPSISAAELQSNLGLMAIVKAPLLPVCVLLDDDTAKRLGNDPATATRHTLRRIEGVDGCLPLPSSAGAASKFVAEEGGACGLQRQMEEAVAAGASGLVVVARGIIVPYPVRLAVENASIPVAVITAASLKHLVNLSSPQTDDIPILLYKAPRSRRGLLVFFVFGVFAAICLVSGMLLSVYGLNGIKYTPVLGAPKTASRSPSKENLLGSGGVIQSKRQNELENKRNRCVEAGSVFIFLGMAITTLLLLYFFYDIFVWVIIVIILLLCAMALKSQLMEVILRLPRLKDLDAVITIEGKWIRSFFGPEVDIRSLVIFPFCLIPSILWLVYRHTSYVWIIQDLCGLFACSFVIKTVRFGSLKLITILVVLFFIYDIFMVYITPFFTKSQPTPRLANVSFPNVPTSPPPHSRVRRSARGESVMESVATGSAGRSGEKIPLAFILPNLNPGHDEVVVPCQIGGYSLLGFGDIIVPGILIAFSFYCDSVLRRSNQQRRCPFLYSVLTLVGYHLGLILVFVLLLVMRVGQPALITLVPCTLVPFVVAVAARGEIRRVWSGDLVQPPPRIPAEDHPPDTEEAQQ